jgi:hypothetical protein
MRRVSLFIALSLALFCWNAISAIAKEGEPVTLIGTIVKWRYPDAEISNSEMSDAATTDASGKRTVPSTLLKTTMTTPDSVQKVIAFYEDLLKRDAAKDSRLGIGTTVGRSVVFSDESEGRPFEFHLIVVNFENTATTLVITRGENEELTHISWKQYLKHVIEG